MGGAHLSFEVSLDQFLQDLTEAACTAALKSGYLGTKKALESSLSKSLKKVLEADLQVSEQCGNNIIGICSHAQRFTPWSKEAKKITK